MKDFKSDLKYSKVIKYCLVILPLWFFFSFVFAYKSVNNCENS